MQIRFYVSPDTRCNVVSFPQFLKTRPENMMKILRQTAACLLLFFPPVFLPVLHAEPLRYFGQTASSYQSKIPYGNNPAAGHYAQSGDARIYYETYGQGDPLVVLHGGLVGSIAEMGEFIDKLSPHYQVIAVSTRGHGKSEAGKAAPTYAQKAQDLRAVLQQVADKPAATPVTPVTLVGFSDGAYTAYQFAAAYPAQTLSLCFTRRVTASRPTSPNFFGS